MNQYVEFLSGQPKHNPYAIMSDARGDYAFTNASEYRVEHVDINGNALVLRGTFDIEGGIATSGTVTGFDVLAADGTKVIKARGFDFDLKDVEGAYFGHENGEIALREMFWRDSDLYGSEYDDVLSSGWSDTLIKGRGGDDDLNGGKGKQTIKGGKGDDSLSGLGGKDTMTGGKGKDTFEFSITAFGKADKITDFPHKADTIFLDHKSFTALDQGVLDGSAFEIGAKAKNDDHRIIYNKKTGSLYYDEDGKGGVDQVKFAKLDTDLNMKANDFLVDA
ncbi:MAG: calcium-binding protein [Hyphomicrobiales bacterium]|nr:calcium-binding protein [Hyphomicrobiales bacterium]